MMKYLVGRGRKVLFSLIIILMIVCGTLQTYGEITEKQGKISDELDEDRPNVFYSCDVQVDGDGFVIKTWPFIFFYVDYGSIDVRPLFGEKVSLNDGSGILLLFFGISQGPPNMIIRGRSLVCYLND